MLGAGYGGLRVALALAGEPGVELTLIDRDRRPADKTRLHNLRGVAPLVDVDGLVASLRCRFLCAEVTRIEREARRLWARGEPISYDFLVLAPGSRTSTRGVPGVREHALAFDTAAGRLAVVGAGPTGIEVATEAARELPRGHVTLVEASPRILAGLGRIPRYYAAASLRRQGVRVLASRSVVALEPGGLRLDAEETLSVDAVAWCAGVEPAGLIAQAGLAAPGASAPVDPFLVSERDPRVYVVGDSAAVPGGTPGRPSAQSAVQQGDFVARDLVRRIGCTPSKPYVETQLGQVVTLGCDAIGQVRVGGASLPVFGAAAQLIKEAASLRNRLTLAARAQRAHALAA